MKFPRGIGCEDPKRKVMSEVSPWHRMAWRRVSRQWSEIVSVIKERTGKGSLLSLSEVGGWKRTIVCTEKIQVFFCGIGPIVLDVKEVVNTHLHHRSVFTLYYLDR